MPSEDFAEQAIRYVSVGDSLTIGHGAKPAESWPSRLVKSLQHIGLNIDLVRNLAFSGYTSRQVLQEQVPVFESLEPTFATLLVGSNDMAKGIDLAVFAKNFLEITDRLQKALANPGRLILLNLPDFASTPAALKYQGHLHLAPLIGHFNRVIEQEAEARSLPLVNLYQITKTLGPVQALYSWDGLHPSAKGYEELEKHIRPVALKLLKNTG